MNRTIADLLRCSHEANFVHHPKGVIIWRNGGVWSVRMCRDSNESVGSVSADASGDSAEAARKEKA